MILFYFAIFLLSVFISAIFTFLTIKIAKHYDVLDVPDNERKKHLKSTPLLGGVAIFLSYFLILILVGNKLIAGNLNIKHWVGFFMGAIFLIIGGVLDDKYKLRPSRQIIFPILSIICVLLGGIEIEKITNPAGGYIFLNTIKIPVFSLDGQLYSITIISVLFIFLWLLGMMYTTKLLDGIDGLVSGVAAVGSFIIFLFTMTTKYYQPDVGLAALILCGCCIGFLIFNFYPARIFLGEGGSLLMGYILGVLSIISGGKIAIALLIMGIPILDVGWTIIRRVKNGKNPFKFGDRQHLHFRIFDAGLGARKTVLIYCLFSFIFGISALFLQSKGKILVLLLLFIIMVILILFFNKLEKKI